MSNTSPAREYIDTVGRLIPLVIDKACTEIRYGLKEYNQVYGLYEWTGFKGFWHKLKMSARNGVN